MLPLDHCDTNTVITNMTKMNYSVNCLFPVVSYTLIDRAAPASIVEPQIYCSLAGTHSDFEILLYILLNVIISASVSSDFIAI